MNIVVRIINIVWWGQFHTDEERRILLKMLGQKFRQFCLLCSHCSFCHLGPKSSSPTSGPKICVKFVPADICVKIAVRIFNIFGQGQLKNTAHITLYIYIYIYIGGWGVRQPGNRFVSFVRASERARDQRFDCAARAVARPNVLLLLLLRLLRRNHAGRVVHEKCCFRTGFFRFLADNLRKTNVKTTFPADNLVKPM